MARASVRVVGGARLRQWIRNASKGGIRAVECGFYRTARYPDGTPATNVAAWNEFGTQRGRKRHSPPRPFLRPAFVAARPKVRRLLKGQLDPKRPNITEREGALVGEVIRQEVREHIVKFRGAPNAPSTIARKKSSRPLIDTGFMRRAVAYKVIP